MSFWPLSWEFFRKSKKEPVVLFGGSFNPPHDGHIHIAEKAHHALGLCEVWMMVAPRNPFKDPAVYADLVHRKALSELSTAHLPWLKVTAMEQDFIKPGEDFIETAETLKILRDMYPNKEFVWMMGSDNILTFHEWGGWEDIVDNHLIMVMNRTQSAEELADVKNAEAIKRSHEKVVIHDENNPVKMERGFYIVESPVVGLSSTMIRENLAKKTPNILGLHEHAAMYINKNGLYNYGGRSPQQSVNPSQSKPKP